MSAISSASFPLALEPLRLSPLVHSHLQREAALGAQ